MMPSLGRAITAGVLGIIIYVAVEHNADRVSTLWSAIMIAIAIGLLAYAIVIGMEYILQSGIGLFGRAWSEFHAPDLRRMQLISGMDAAQLAALGRAQLTIRMRAAGKGHTKTFETPAMDLGQEEMEYWARRHYDHPAWPEMITQHGKSDASTRHQLQAFTWWVVNAGLAEAPRGRLPGRWKIGREKLYEALEL